MDIWHHGAPLGLPAEVKGKMNDFGSERQFITFTSQRENGFAPREKVGEERKCCVYTKLVTSALLLLLLFLARGGQAANVERRPAREWPSPQMSRRRRRLLCRDGGVVGAALLSTRIWADVNRVSIDSISHMATSIAGGGTPFPPRA